MVLPMVLPQFALSQMPTAGGMNGPIDVQAGEQDFEGDHVVAKGSVRVTYKDSVIVAPMATLYKDANGAMQRAVFTGRPHLTQTTSKVEADTLIFEMATQIVIAEGNAHSEVISRGGEEGGKVESIVTDSDRQEYDRNSGKFVATGRVRVDHGDIKARADKLNLVYGQDNKPETAIFTGHAEATQRQNSTKADTITYFLRTQRLQATGHVQSRVVQKKAQADLKAVPAQQLSEATALESPAHAAAAKANTEVITIFSDSQDMSQDNGRITADGNVKMFYQDTSGVGPKMIISRSKEGKPEKIFFVGRSQIRQPGKSWIADRITFTCADKKVLAMGNSRAFILRPGEAPTQQQVESQLAETAGKLAKPM